MRSISRRTLHLLRLIALLAIATRPSFADSLSTGRIELHVDASDVARGIFRVNETVPVTGPGRLVLLYPKWLPGYHAPAGPIDKLGGLVVSAHGKSLPWRRDPADAYAFEIDVPHGARSVDLQFQYLSPVAPEQGRIVMTPEMLALEWNTVVLYPQGVSSASVTIAASVTLPPNWQFATSLTQTDFW